ncbi:leukocyte elastase inhibitor-like [Esox lucius]|uniref:Leukocyte elastase inhibitor n=1 Tax=Esox lucius TaxID=8010 RepID=A0A3P8Z9U3_ESOLU|nr:leukocyte elastase inhibitor-like [Esox lucius]XP_028972184.2 leukocyte elastase inhibitor-like [Esox lucius]XP_028972185.2 leukocyte elastase inhibitor-like [Esox lucius]XP_028972186.2 leukocyte elastase inhibitor-like [Esox lucius]XP_028972187.2 leukocyte elastase inhibitor-like [Esox lucius]
MESVSVANNEFSLDLFKKITEKNKTGNVFYSPLSISSALAMVSLGARGNTVTQMSESLHLHKTKDDVHVGFSKLMSELNKEGTLYELRIANRLYGEQSYQFVKTFLHNTKKHYNAELEAVDFKSNAETVRQNINTWVEKQTAEKIKDVLPKGIVDQITRLALVNAIYFKGNWEKKFSETRTRDANFRLNKNDSKPVKMMYQKAEFPIMMIYEARSLVLEMPYEGNQLSMLIMLPKDIEDDTTGLEELEKQLTYENFVQWTRPDYMNTVEVEVGLPKFKLEESLDLKETLGSMGMIDAFDNSRSDFSGMSPNNDLVLSKVVHKAFVEVNEEGTEAAAATAAIMAQNCALKIPPFIADHPFLFFIRHNPTQSILFSGRYSSP